MRHIKEIVAEMRPEIETAYISCGVIDGFLQLYGKELPISAEHLAKIDPAIRRAKTLLFELELAAEHEESCDGEHASLDDRFAIATTTGFVLEDRSDVYLYRGVRVEIGTASDGGILYGAFVDGQPRTSRVFRELETLIDDSLPDHLTRHDHEQVR